MLPRSALLLAVLGAGCASSPPRNAPAAPVDAPVPDLLLGLPPSVVVGRALFDLESGDPQRTARARSVLVAVPESPALDPLRERARTAPRDSAQRLDALAILAERGEPVDGCEAEDLVAMNLREIERRERSGRPVILALDRLRNMGEAARDPLRDEARHGGPRARVASRILSVLFGEDVAAAGPRP